MKRIVVWIDSRDQDVEQIRTRLQRFLKSIGITPTIFDPCELACSYSDGK